MGRRRSSSTAGRHCRTAVVRVSPGGGARLAFWRGTDRADLLDQGGTAANLSVGRQVTVKGRLSPDGLRMEATSIGFD